MQHAAQPAWFDTFWTSYRDLVRFLRRRTGCHETARDLAHDAWLRVSGPGRADGSASVPPANHEHARAYLFTVAERLAIDHQRRQRLWATELAPRLLAGPQRGPDAAETHAYAQALRSVDHALATMPDRTREVFIAHRLMGVPHEELAQRYAVSRKTIEREISQAMDLAQASLERGPVLAGEAPARRGRRKAMAALLGVGGLGMSTAWLWQLMRAHVPQWQTALAVPLGKTARTTLPDGTQVDLDADTELDVRLFAARREVRLRRGGAFFAVAHEAARPFVVLAGPARITVLGTRFAVDLQGDGATAIVESGRVAVEGEHDGPPLQLGPGETATVAPGEAPRPGAPRRPDAVAPWRSGWLDFDRVPLAEAAQRLNRYRPAALVRVDPAIASLPVLARVNIARSTQWLQGLPGSLPVAVGAGASGEVLISPR